MHIIDRRLNPGSKSLENRQRFLRRAKALVQRCGQEVLPGPRHQGHPGGRRGQHPARRHGRAALPSRQGGTRDMVLPGNKKFIEGDILPRSGGGGGKQQDAGAGRRRGCVSLRAEPRRVPRPVPRRSGTARSRQAQARRGRERGHSARRLCDLGLAGQYLGQPHRASRAGAPGRIAAAAAGSDRKARGGARRMCRRGASRRAAGRDRGAEGKGAAGFPSSIRSTSATAASRPCRSRWRRR